MNSRKIILGVAVGVAALAVTGMLLAKNESKRARLSEKAEEAKKNFKNKLNELQRKAKKEFSDSLEEGERLANKAKERANDWVNKPRVNNGIL